MDVRRIAALGLVLALAAGAGCGVILNRAGENLRKQQNAAEPFADGLDTGSKRKKPKKPARAIVHTAAYDASDGLVDGALDSLDDPKRRAQLEELGDDLDARVGSTTKTAGAGLVDGLNEKLPEMRPVLAEMLVGVKADLGLDPEGAARRITRAALAEAGDGMRTNVRPQVRAMTDDVVASLRDGLGGVLGPELQQKVRDHVVPAIKEITKDAPQLAEDIGHGAAKGLGDGLAVSLDPDTEGGLGQSIERLLDRTVERAREPVDDWLGRSLLVALIIAIVALLIAVVRWLGERHEKLRARQAQTAAEEQGRKNERMLELVASAIHDVGAGGSLEQFRARIKELSRDGAPLEIRAALDEFLTRRKLKLERPRA